MKKVFVFSFVLLLISTFSFAAAFSPTIMKLSGPANVTYAFDGSAIKIPVTVTGTPVFLRFFVFTKDKTAEIIDIRNGFMGWHYMNKIDTCIFQSGDYKFTPGTSDVTWNGVDNDGGVVPSGAYTYYLWGYDDQTPRYNICPGYPMSHEADHISDETFLTVDEAGVALANPILASQDMRWIIGNDPDDPNLFEPVPLLRTLVGRPDLVLGLVILFSLTTGAQFMSACIMRIPQQAHFKNMHGCPMMTQ